MKKKNPLRTSHTPKTKKKLELIEIGAFMDQYSVYSVHRIHKSNPMQQTTINFHHYTFETNRKFTFREQSIQGHNIASFAILFTSFRRTLTTSHWNRK